MGVSTAAAQERTLLDSDVPPVLRQSRVFVPVRVVGNAIGATVAWNGATETVTLVRGAVTVELRIGSTSAKVNGSPRTLSAAPFIQNGRTMVPIRFVSESLGVRVDYDSRTFSVVVGPVSGILWVLPLSDPESGVDIPAGIVILLPEANSSVSSPVKVHGQANVFEGAVTIEIRDNNDQVIATGFGTGRMGSYGLFTATIPYTLSAGAPLNGARVFVYSEDASGNGGILQSDSVSVRLL